MTRIQRLSELMANQKLLALALDLTRRAPRGVLAPLGVYGAVVARMVDKCRAELAGTPGSYHYNCPLDRDSCGFVTCARNLEWIRAICNPR